MKLNWFTSAYDWNRLTDHWNVHKIVLFMLNVCLPSTNFHCGTPLIFSVQTTSFSRPVLSMCLRCWPILHLENFWNMIMRIITPYACNVMLFLMKDFWHSKVNNKIHKVSENYCWQKCHMIILRFKVEGHASLTEIYVSVLDLLFLKLINNSWVKFKRNTCLISVFIYW